jgi:hypothetical protein
MGEIENLDRIQELETLVRDLTPWALVGAESILCDDRVRITTTVLPNGIVKVLDQQAAQEIVERVGAKIDTTRRRFSNTGVEAPRGMRTFDEWLADELGAEEGS